MKSVVLLMVVVMFPAMAPSYAQNQQGLAPLEKLSQIHREYQRRAQQTGDTAADRLALAKWALEQKMYNDARMEYDKVLSLEPDNAEVRRVMGYEKTGSGWEINVALLAKDITVSADPEVEKNYGNNALYREMVEFLKKPETREAIIREIVELTGFHRFPGELDVTVVIAANVPNDAIAFTQTPGYTADACRLKVTVSLNARKMMTSCTGSSMEFMRRVTRHEFVHVLCLPACNKWPSWVNEGLASYVDREEFQLRELVDAGFDDIEAKPKTYIQNYARGYVLWEYIAERFGKDAVTKIIREMVLSYGAFPKIVTDVTRKSWPEFKSGLTAYGKERVSAFAAKYGIIAPSTPWLGLLPWWQEGKEVVVCFTTPGSAAEKGGIHGGDVVTHIDRQPIVGCRGLVEFLAKKKAGETIKITFRRNGKTVEVAVTLGPAPAMSKGEFDSVRQIL